MPSTSRIRGSRFSCNGRADEVSITISDDGPGFAPEVIDRIGAPYVTQRRPEPRGPEAEEDPVFGLGLGFFIAKTLLERSGAKLALINQAPPLHGATVSVTWSRADFERPITPSPLEPRPPRLKCKSLFRLVVGVLLTPHFGMRSIRLVR